MDIERQQVSGDEHPPVWTIQRQQVMDACRALGLEPGHVRDMQLDGDEVRVTMFYLDESGARVYYEANGRNYARLYHQNYTIVGAGE